MNRHHRSFPRLGAVGALLLLNLGVAVAAESSPPQDQSVDLKYEEATTSLVNVGLGGSSVSKPFPKEPAVSQQVSRGKFRVGGRTTEELAYLWDRKNSKLYLDLNHNENLTDDPNGVITADVTGSGSYGSFHRVRLPVQTPAGAHEQVGDLMLYNYGSTPNGWLGLRSLWRGKLTLQGADWDVGVFSGNLSPLTAGSPNWLLLRPWARHAEPFAAQDGAQEVVAMSDKLFLNGQAYALTLTNVAGAGADTLKLVFQARQPALGELQIAGKFIDRLVMAGPWLTIWDRPAGTIRVPTGSYTRQDVCLREGKVAAYLEERNLLLGQPLAIGKAPAKLVVGGPLTNSVEVSRRGASLSLSYALIGAGGQKYALVGQDRSRPPEWTAYRGDAKVGSGKFEFG